MLVIFRGDSCMRHLLAAIALGSLVGGCTRADMMMTRYHDDGRAKPVLAIAPVIDTTMFDLPWSLSEELTATVVQKVGKSGKIFISSREDDTYTSNPFGVQLDWMKKTFEDQEFVAFLELVKHEAVPSREGETSTQESSVSLEMALRLRVIDLRSARPSIVLQETIRDNYFVPKELCPSDYNVIAWGTEDFNKSPMGIAHAQLLEQAATRISDYVLLAKSR